MALFVSIRLNGCPILRQQQQQQLSMGQFCRSNKRFFSLKCHRHYIPPHRQQRPSHAESAVLLLLLRTTTRWTRQQQQQRKHDQNRSIGGAVIGGMTLASGLGSAVIMAQTEGGDDGCYNNKNLYLSSLLLPEVVAEDGNNSVDGNITNVSSYVDNSNSYFDVVATSSSTPTTTSSLRRKDFFLQDHHHGKTRVRILKVHRDDNHHSISEYTVETKLFCQDYDKCFIHQDNTDLVATDTQRNTVYVVAKQCHYHQMATPEDFGMALAKHFLQEYSMLSAVEIKVQQVLWQRATITAKNTTIGDDDDDAHPVSKSSFNGLLLEPDAKHSLTQQQKPHPHAFLQQGPETYACHVRLERNNKYNKLVGKITSSIQKMTILKTTQSGFEHYLQDKYTLLPPTTDRCLATELDATWTYHVDDDNNNNEQQVVDYAHVRRQVRERLLYGIFGPPPHGVYSASLQATIYDAACLVLDHVPQVESIKIDTPNLHYLPFMQLHQLGETFENDIFVPTSEPSGIITCTVARK